MQYVTIIPSDEWVPMSQGKYRYLPRAASPESRPDWASDFYSPTTVSPFVPGPTSAKSGPDTVMNRVGRYHVKDVIGRGGMGEVLLGYDAHLGRELAIKVLQSRHAADPVMLRRFLDEARLTGQLDHPGVPSVHEMGWLDDGRPFFTMRLVRGRTLARLLDDRHSSTDRLPELVGIFSAVCRTVAHAHSRRIIHRDLKPGNVMIGTEGEVQVLDWGLGKKLGVVERRPTSGSGLIALTRPSSNPSLDGTALGTPAFMPPEQARWEMWRLDERADVFGLGAILCVLLTGEPPYRGDDPYGQACTADLDDAHARLRNCPLNPDLVRLALACLDPEAEARPRDAEMVSQMLDDCLIAEDAQRRRDECARIAAQTRVEVLHQHRRCTLALAVALCLTLPALCISQLRTRLSCPPVPAPARQSDASVGPQPCSPEP